MRNTSLNEIDTFLLNEYVEKFYGKRADEFGVPVEQLLKNLQILTPDGQVTLAGLLFFGKHPEMYQPALIIKAVSFYGNEKSVGVPVFQFFREFSHLLRDHVAAS